MTGHIYAFLTATRVVWHGESADDYTEEHGWVDPWWGVREVHESRNDVRPVADWAEDTDWDMADWAVDLADAVNHALGFLPGGPEGDNQDGTFYSADSETEMEEPGWVWSYAVHFSRKRNDPVRGWVEDRWHPVVDGGVDPAEIGLD